MLYVLRCHDVDTRVLQQQLEISTKGGHFHLEVILLEIFCFCTFYILQHICFHDTLTLWRDLIPRCNPTTPTDDPDWRRLLARRRQIPETCSRTAKDQKTLDGDTAKTMLAQQFSTTVIREFGHNHNCDLISTDSCFGEKLQHGT